MRKATPPSLLDNCLWQWPKADAD